MLYAFIVSEVIVKYLFWSYYTTFFAEIKLIVTYGWQLEILHDENHSEATFCN